MNRPLMDYAAQTIAVGSKSFAAASQLFDADTRRSVLMLYAWCRHCDDVIDGQTLGFSAQLPPAADPLQRLALLESDTLRACSNAPMEQPAFAALQEVVNRHNIAPDLALAHLQGFAMDVHQARYDTFDDTLRYCYHVAGVVGLMMARVMGVRDEAVLDRACDLGLAFQLTNIARDIVEDARAGRCYLPTQWLEDAGLTVDNLTDPAGRQALAQLARRLVSAAESYYASARSGLAGLPLRSAWAISTAHGVYRQIGIKVTAAGPRAWDRRQGTNHREKLRLLLKGAVIALGSRLTAPAPRDPSLWQRPHI